MEVAQRVVVVPVVLVVVLVAEIEGSVLFLWVDQVKVLLEDP